MKRHHIVGIIAGISGCLLAIHQAFFRGMISEAIITFIVLSIVATSTFFKEKYPIQFSHRLLPRWVYIVLTLLSCTAIIWIEIKGCNQSIPTQKALQTTTPNESEQAATLNESDTPGNPSSRQKVINILKGENFTKKIKESRKAGTIPEPLTSVSKFQEYLVEQGMTEVENIDFTNHYQNLFQKYFPGKEPSDLDTKMKQQLITTIQDLGYEKGRETFRSVPENAIWLAARFDPIQDMGETLGKWTERVLADDFGNRTIDEILEVPFSEPSLLEHSPTELMEPLIDSDSQSKTSQEPVETSQNDITSGETAQKIFHEKIEQVDIVDIESTLQELLTDQDSENPLGDFESALREQLNPERFSPQRLNTAIQILNRYGPEGGLHRLKESDPEIATQIERLIHKEQEDN
ncbi:MAG: hypothetical protein OXN27_10835 [Candidatus Poribacteria bacterium]|nr:hypothetical protein [Candidatus Poribacteria bacterium]